MSVLRGVLRNLTTPILVLFLTPLVTAAGSAFATGDWWQWFGSVPVALWMALAAGTVFWIAAIQRLKHLQQGSGSPVSFIAVPYDGWHVVDQTSYADVLWNVRIPRPSKWDLDPRPVEPHDLDIATPPRCPKCKTELEEARSFWGGYVWRCVACGFSKRNRESYYREAERVEKIVRRQYELYLTQTTRK
jgi:ribosomal protein L37AE/L43A